MIFSTFLQVKKYFLSPHIYNQVSFQPTQAKCLTLALCQTKPKSKISSNDSFMMRSIFIFLRGCYNGPRLYTKLLDSTLEMAIQHNTHNDCRSSSTVCALYWGGMPNSFQTLLLTLFLWLTPVRAPEPQGYQGSNLGQSLASQTTYVLYYFVR